MNVTPLDLRQQKFKSAMRGYDRGEVDALLAEVADDYEGALRDADRLRQEVARLESALAEHRSEEKSLKNTAAVTAFPEGMALSVPVFIRWINRS